MLPLPVGLSSPNFGASVSAKLEPIVGVYG